MIHILKGHKNQLPKCSDAYLSVRLMKPFTTRC